MLDLNYVCEHPEEIEQNCRHRGASVDIARILALRAERNRWIQTGDELRREQKDTSGRIPQAPDQETRQKLIDRGKQLRTEVAEVDERQKASETELFSLLKQIPNLTHPDAPVGEEQDHVTLRTWGTIPSYDFKPLDHVELAQRHDLIDFESGTRVAGHGFYFFKNEAVLLELALMRFALETLRRKGFTLYSTPDLARDDVLEGTGYIPRGEETQIYSIQNTDLSLVATAEITLGGSRKDQLLDHAELPIRMAGISHCFRTEAGAHGRATRGIYRVHQFAKVEMFAFTAPDLAASNAMLEEIVSIEEEIFQALEIPYRVIDTPTGDLGGPAYRKYDLEAWMPGRGESGEFGEVTSASNCTDYQARRLNVRTKLPEQKGNQFVHTLNGTAIAISRAMIALLENHQQSDGSIVIPEPLRQWTGVERIG
jgi:seryl-tRNA synthetase